DKVNAQSCLERYERAEIHELQKIQDALAKNDNNHSKLMSQKEFVDGSQPKNTHPPVAVDLPESPTAPGLLPVQPKIETSYFITRDELEKQYQAQEARMRSKITEGFSQWLAELAKPPSRDEFVVTKEIWRNPGHPEAGKLRIIATQADGVTPIYDDKAFSAA